MRPIVAHFTTEAALDQILHTYGGGLGVFSGGFAKEAHRLDLPFVGVTLLPSEGYYDQRISDNGMVVAYTLRTYENILEDTGVCFPIEICGKPVWIKVLRLPAGKFESSEFLFLTTDIPENDWLSRQNTMRLYPSGANMRHQIAKAMILGIAGVEALKRLDKNVAVYHLNESYAAFAAVELLRRRIIAGESFDVAQDAVRAQVVFTTHTPVPEGNPEYALDEVVEMLGNSAPLAKKILARLGGVGEDSTSFNMTAVCLCLARKANAVSRRHLEIAARIWHWVEGACPLISITNGAHRDTWQPQDFRSVETQEELQRVKLTHKRRLLGFVQETTGKHWSENIPIVVWSRRFARYKRPDLLLYDMEWLVSQLRANKFQLVMAGKPHPDDLRMIELWNRLLQLSKELPNLAIIPGYELDMMGLFKLGADLWLNTPQSPLEACGTSGMGAAMVGTIHMSTPDGWACEEDPANCFLFGTKYPLPDQDVFDAKQMRECIEEAVLMYTERPAEWYDMALRAKREAEERWTMQRMVREYYELLYELSLEEKRQGAE